MYISTSRQFGGDVRLPWSADARDSVPGECGLLTNEWPGGARCTCASAHGAKRGAIANAARIRVCGLSGRRV
eukprot:6154769-Prymnesium_polylepis.1